MPTERDGATARPLDEDIRLRECATNVARELNLADSVAVLDIIEQGLRVYSDKRVEGAVAAAYWEASNLVTALADKWNWQNLPLTQAILDSVAVDIRKLTPVAHDALVEKARALAARWRELGSTGHTCRWNERADELLTVLEDGNETHT